MWVYRTYNYYYPQYSDCYEPTSEALDEFKITVAKYEPNGAWYTADPDKGVTVRLEDKNEVNKILWNIKHRNISYEAIEAYFATLNK